MLREILRPVPNGSLEGAAVEAVALLPQDDPPQWEGDDGVHAPGSGRYAAAFVAAQAAAKASVTSVGPRVVPFVRVVHPRMGGQDVIAIQRALQAAGFRKLRPTGWHGPISVANLKAFQRAHDVLATGAYGRPTHHHFRPYFDGYGAWLMMQAAAAAEAKKKMRARIVAAALFGVRVRDQIHYSQGPHRMDGILDRLRPPRFPTECDCSSFACWTYWDAHAPDPAGFHWDLSGTHYTGTMSRAGHKVADTAARPGDLVFYGDAWPFKHVTIYIGSGRCVSQGGESGPLVLPVRYRADLAMVRAYI